jgi:hypothetical protein
MGDGEPQPIGSGSNTMLKMVLGSNSIQKLAQELRFSHPYKWPISLIPKQCETSNIKERKGLDLRKKGKEKKRRKEREG